MNKVWCLALVSLALASCEIDTAGGDDGYWAVFDDARGLSGGDRVYVSGVRVGRVKKVALEATKARVVFDIESNTAVPIYKDACVTVSWHGFSGKPHLKLEPGNEGAQALPPNAQVECVKTAADNQSEKLDDMIDKAGTILGQALTGKGTIGKLLNDEALAAKVEAFFNKEGPPAAEPDKVEPEEPEPEPKPKTAPKAKPKATPKAKPKAAPKAPPKAPPAGAF